MTLNKSSTTAIKTICKYMQLLTGSDLKKLEARYIFPIKLETFIWRSMLSWVASPAKGVRVDF